MRSFGLSSVADELTARSHPAADNVKHLDSTLREVLSAERVAGLHGPDGLIDFERQRSLYGTDKSNLKLRVPGRSYVGEPGEWYADDRPDELWIDDPFWLLAILEAVVEAVAQGDEAALGTTCRRYTGLADFKLAGAIAGRVVNPPPAPERMNLSRLPIEVWLDDAGRIRRALLHGMGTSVTQMEMWAFGEPDPIELPPPGQVLSA
jgi:hypothetical protein